LKDQPTGETNMKVIGVALCALVVAAVAVLSSATLASTQAKPDLRVTELTVEEVQTTNVPLRLRVGVTIKNFGATTSGSFTTRLSYRNKSSAPYAPLYDFHSGVRQLNGGDHWDRNFDFQESGTYSFKVEVDADKQIAESVEANNTRTLAKAFAAGTPDLVVTNLAAKFTSVTPSGAHARVDWDVENSGDGRAAGSFVTVLKVSKNGTNFVELARFQRTGLDKGKNFHFFKDVTYSDVRSLRFMVTVDGTNTIHELREGNNNAYSETIKP
jgi:subtilase family serine protease